MSVQYEVVAVEPWHVEELSRTMRAPDVAEVKLIDHTPKQALDLSIAASRDAFTALADGKVVAIFGISPTSLLSETALIWMLSSPEIEKHGRMFLRRSLRYLKQLSAEFKVLYNFVDGRNVVAIRWLRWTGFSFLRDPIPFRGEQVLFFEMRQPDV